MLTGNSDRDASVSGQKVKGEVLVEVAWYKVIAGNRVIGSFSIIIPEMGSGEAHFSKLNEVIARSVMAITEGSGLKSTRVSYVKCDEAEGVRLRIPTEDRVARLEARLEIWDPGIGDPGIGDPGIGDPGIGDPGSHVNNY